MESAYSDQRRGFRTAETCKGRREAFCPADPERRCHMPEEEITDGLMMKYVRWMMRNGKDKEEYTEEEIDAFVDRFMRERMAGG